jgi:hypothetical protein
MTHAMVSIELAAFTDAWIAVGAAGMAASARWELRDAATSVTAAMAKKDLRMSLSSACTFTARQDRLRLRRQRGRD